MVPLLQKAAPPSTGWALWAPTESPPGDRLFKGQDCDAESVLWTSQHPPTQILALK